VSDDSKNEPIIELHGVSKRFGSVVVLDKLDLALAQGQTTVVIGESGTGKSVLLKHIVGLIKPDDGKIFFHGKRIDDQSEANLVESRKRFGVLFQQGALFDSMTIAENVAFPIIQHSGKPPPDLEEIVKQKLTMVGLEALHDRRPGEVSGGQKKRAALARAIALNPEIVLYDEPTTGLDPVRADVINELILKLKRELKVTGVVVTHDMTSAYKVADRIVMLHHGKIIADEKPEWYHKSKDPRVRRFVDGHANLEDLAALDG
jgi:phospholipid/cholesterol/gamma-HCH transport system ATP-binding protein